MLLHTLVTWPSFLFAALIKSHDDQDDADNK